MTRKRLTKLFNKKLSDEIEEFKNQVRCLEKEEIIDRAYRINMMQEIYDYLSNLGEEVSKKMMKKLLECENLISDIYWSWIQYDCIDNEMLYECIDDAIVDMCER